MTLRRLSLVFGFGAMAALLGACESAQESIESVFTEEEPIRLFCPDVRVVESTLR